LSLAAGRMRIGGGTARWQVSDERREKTRTRNAYRLLRSHHFPRLNGNTMICQGRLGTNKRAVVRKAHPKRRMWRFVTPN
jgi:hypothetical protein